MIGSQQLTPGTFNQHLLRQQRTSQRTRRIVIAGLMLTSMVDMFSLLVIFLLQSFSSSPEIKTVGKDLRLPIAMTASAVKDIPVITISENLLTLDNQELGKPNDVYNRPDKLLDLLKQLKRTWISQHPKEEFPAELQIQADAGLPATLVSNILQLIIMDGFSTLHLATVSGNR